MEKQKLIAALAETQEDQILLAKVWDRITAGSRRNIPAGTSFLSGREQMLVQNLCRQGGLPDPIFFGGFSGAERQIALYLPDYCIPETYLLSEEGPVAALRVTYSHYDTLNHRDFLGSLMAKGIKREILGDLLPGEGHCDVMVLREMADYLSRELTHVGRAAVHTAGIPLTDVHVPEQKFKRIQDTVASLRLDSVLASGFQQGRSKAAGYIHAGKVSVNHMTVWKPDAMVEEGALISAQGIGKLRLTQVRGETKKGRIAIIVERFL